MQILEITSQVDHTWLHFAGQLSKFYKEFVGNVTSFTLLYSTKVI
jgi:hypothetical protein